MIPTNFKPYLWSYDFDKLDKIIHKNIIIENILNSGSFEISQQLFNLYNKEEVKNVFNKLKRNHFNKKSHNFWSKILA